ncbi:integrase catalytic domain-containing protein [Trichonephila clavipes]|nr:integrase catalytic domain-containing protein [Trichonephila clavipes]
MDDNYRSHRVNLLEDFLFEEGIVRMEWRSCSPDMNPIEHVWDALGRRVVECQPPTKTLQELERALLEERFIARRGRPRIIYCHNGTNLSGAFNDLAKLDWHKISNETSTQKIVWKFIPPSAAWWGGWWERLVRIIKELLRRSLGKSILSYEELSTVICDCEFLINSRPL